MAVLFMEKNYCSTRLDKPQVVDPISPKTKFILNHYLPCPYEFGDTGSVRLVFAPLIKSSSKDGLLYFKVTFLHAILTLMSFV